MKQVFLLIASLVLIFSCNKSEKINREGILTPEQMTNALIHIHLCEGKVSHTFFTGDSAKLYYLNLENAAFKKMGITKAQYEKSYAFYSNQVEEFDDIYTRVVDSLSLREQLKKYY